MTHALRYLCVWRTEI